MEYILYKSHLIFFHSDSRFIMRILYEGWILSSVYIDKKAFSDTKMHIILDKRLDYFDLKGIFQGGAKKCFWRAEARRMCTLLG